AAETLQNEKFDVVIYGKAKRVVGTAQAVFDILRKEPDTVVQTGEIREMDFGLFEGMHYREIVQQYPEQWQRYMDDWRTYAFPQGDSIAEYYSFCSEWIGGVVERYPGKDILIVGHKGFILNCLSALLTQDGGDVLSRDIGNAETVTLTLG
ncbi:MAG: histidine phosphatase family protein, partial [Christensenella sp.]|uniref:histidine phosphatase family protein n=1 Tax=Christensenella sp. TaxID=1935934 RepID=UPI002B203627